MISDLKKEAGRMGADAVLIDKKYFEAQSMGFTDRPGSINGMAIKTSCQ